MKLYIYMYTGCQFGVQRTACITLSNPDWEVRWRSVRKQDFRERRRGFNTYLGRVVSLSKRIVPVPTWLKNCRWVCKP